MRTTSILFLLAVAWPALLAAEDGAPAGKPRMVSVMPRVVGSTHRAALVAMRDANVGVRVVEEASPSDQIGYVLTQDPVAGAQVDPGAIATIHVGVANDVPTVVPRLLGRDINAVRKRYEALYVLEIVAIEDATAGRPGIVLKQHPEPGTNHPFRGRVRIELVPRPSVVPDVVAKNADVARTLLEGEGFRVSVGTEERKGVLPGSVLSQDPKPGASVAYGTLVRLIVSGGSTPVVPIPAGSGVQAACPDFVGMSFFDAHEWVRALGLVPRSYFVRVDDGESLRVTKQDRVAGFQVAEGSVLTLTVARRATPAKDLPIPMLLGHTKDDAKRVLEGLGYRPRVMTRPSPLPPGTVLEQLPRAGRPAAQGSDLVLYVAETPPSQAKLPTIALPDMRRRRVADALVFLYSRNFPVRVHTVPTSGTPMDRIVEQDPAPGTELQMGQPVTLRVPARVRVPNVVGLDAQEARTKLQSAGLLSAAIAGGPFVVVRQDPAANRVASRGSGMKLEVAPLAVEQPAGVLLPDLRGLSVTDARQTLKSLGLELRQVDSAEGLIRGQDPAPGERVAPGSTVAVRVGP